ncbi:MAG: DUF2252 family protein [Sphingomonas sp.]
MRVAPADRAALLKTTRQRKMTRSVHAYVRGNTARFYEWLAASPVAKIIPEGPPIWICGDCHLGNLGPVADAEQRIAVQIRDLDQTVIGNPALDLVRLGLSLQAAARSSDLPGVTTARMIEALAEAYIAALDEGDEGEVPAPDVVRKILRRAAGRRWRHLAKERIEGTDPVIPLGKRFWPLEEGERAAIDALFASNEVRERTLQLADAGHKGAVRVVDAAYWRKGCSSLGTLRYAVLIGVRVKGAKDEYLALVDIKEAVRPLAPVAKGAKMPRDPAKRVVAGATALAPHLGERMIAARLLGRPVVMRELKPQDLKLEIAQLSEEDAVGVAAYLAHVVGRAHARQLDGAERRAWRATFLRQADARIDAPSWLWRAVVDLAGAHESAYLDHCRSYAIV